MSRDWYGETCFQIVQVLQSRGWPTGMTVDSVNDTVTSVLWRLTGVTDDGVNDTRYLFVGRPVCCHASVLRHCT